MRVTPKYLSTALHQPNTDKDWWNEYFTELVDADDLLLYDLTSVFFWSENIKLVEKGYNA